MGLFYDGFEEQFKALVAIEACCSLALKSASKKGGELRSLKCSINYDTKVGSVGRDKLKGTGLILLMKPKSLSWNVWGINDVNKRLRIRSLICSWKIDIVCFQGTKLGFIYRIIICSLWWCSFVGWAYLALWKFHEVLFLCGIIEWSWWRNV